MSEPEPDKLDMARARFQDEIAEAHRRIKELEAKIKTIDEIQADAKARLQSIADKEKEGV